MSIMDWKCLLWACKMPLTTLWISSTGRQQQEGGIGVLAASEMSADRQAILPLSKCQCRYKFSIGWIFIIWEQLQLWAYWAMLRMWSASFEAAKICVVRVTTWRRWRWLTSFSSPLSSSCGSANMESICTVGMAFTKCSSSSVQPVLAWAVRSIKLN